MTGRIIGKQFFRPIIFGVLFSVSALAVSGCKQKNNAAELTHTDTVAGAGAVDSASKQPTPAAVDQNGNRVHTTNVSFDNEGRAILPTNPLLKPEDPLYNKTVGTPEEFHVYGKLIGGARGEFTVVQAGVIGLNDKPILSQVVKPDESFGFKGMADQPQVLNINFPTGTIQIIVRPGDKIELTVPLTDVGQYQVKGSIESAQLDTMYSIINIANIKKENYAEAIKELYKKVQTADPGSKGVLNREYAHMLDKKAETYTRYDREKQENIKRFIQRIGDSYVGLIAMGYLKDMKHVDYLIELEKKYTKLYPNSIWLATLRDKIAMGKNYASGQKAANLRLEEPDGRSIQVSDFEGKVTLLEFWASWCSPCRQQVPSLKKIYAKHSPKGFTIFSISIDKQKDAWLKALKDENMPWKQGVDLLGTGGEVGKHYLASLNALPSNLLLDRNGKIIGRNLFGDELDRAVTRALKN